MEQATLRFTILQLIEQHESKEPGTYLDDTAMANELHIALADVQRQLLILENRSLVELAKAMGPSYSALLTSNGMEALESARTQPEVANRRIGF
jgi:transcription initiation factor IIE alpha subunit